MRRAFAASILALALVLSGALTTHAAALSGLWTAKYHGQTLQLQFKGSGNRYAGTFTISVKNGAKTLKSVMPMKAVLTVVNTITNVTITMTKDHTVVRCALIKASLRCIAANQQAIVFSHTHG